jgi:hypothetical protein
MGLSSVVRQRRHLSSHPRTPVRRTHHTPCCATRAQGQPQAQGGGPTTIESLQSVDGSEAGSSASEGGSARNNNGGGSGRTQQRAAADEMAAALVSAACVRAKMLGPGGAA